ncbi:ATP-binding cassette domain-containing protein [Streptomyces sp. DSM 110735]|uniref:ATP-binding cassette domain-containing protein n=1 Tax=Streptomyces sp. DSM 110735 TaxID=2775031 RepID=UPI0018F75AC6|nr:ATP-binding cassette domain-containing protein [Streptomyces sp. DSM 110735]MBJ7906818.1 ATP-binding cassette domain-containing protein [Streptomyces sp. DSM 110735]
MRLEGVGLRYGWRGPWVLRDIQLDVPAGQLIRVQGVNGCGKSTLLRVVAGAVRPARGRVAGRTGRAAYVPERFPATLPFTSVQYLRLMGRAHGLTAAEGERRGRHLLERFGAGQHAERPLAELSKGTCQKVAVAQALLGEPALLVLDEAWTGLDAESRGALDEAVEQRVSEGATVVYVDHAPDRLADRTDLLWTVGDGTVTVNRQITTPPVLIEFTGGPPDTAALPGVRTVTTLADGTVRLQTDEEHSDALLRALLAAEPGGGRTGTGVHIRRVSGGRR